MQMLRGLGSGNQTRNPLAVCTGNKSLDTELKCKSCLNERRGVDGGDVCGKGEVWRRGRAWWEMGGNNSSRCTHVLNV